MTIHCIGDAMVDEYYSVKVERISPEFPMPIMHSVSPRPVYRPGGVANVAYQLKNFNVDVRLVCLWDNIGMDVFSLHNLKFKYGYMYQGGMLPVKRRFLDGKVQVNRWDIEKPNYGLDEDAYHSLQKQLLENYHTLPRADVAILSDYDKGFFRFDYAEQWIKKLKSLGVRTVVDPKKGPLDRWRGCNVFKPNLKEAQTLAGVQDIKLACEVIKEKLCCDIVIVTRSDSAPFVYENNDFWDVNNCPRTPLGAATSTVGAGDCFAAIFGLTYAHNLSMHEAVIIADNAGRVYVKGEMNTPLCPAELNFSRKVDAEDLAHRDFKLVFTNGCFDLLHSGHLDTLTHAKRRGDKLVVAVNSDESVRRLKGDKRPVNSLAERMNLLAGLKMVDFVISFDEDTPLEAIKKCRPDVIVKGGDYKEENIVGSGLVPEVYVAPFLDGYSTTEILKRMNS